MNVSDLARFRTQIQTRLAALETENRLGQDAQSVVQLDQQMVGRLSRMDALQNQAMARAQQSRRDSLRHRLNAALARIETDDFGYCEDCGDAIAPKRLGLDPSVTRCISCASA